MNVVVVLTRTYPGKSIRQEHIGESGVPGTWALRHRKLRNPDEKRSYVHTGTSCMDQRLSHVGLRQPRGESEIDVCSCQDIVGVKTPIEGTPNPGIKSGIGISLIRVCGDFSCMGN